MHTYKRDGWLSVWVQAALGLAGLTVTILAVIAFERAGDRPVPAPPSPSATNRVTFVKPRPLIDEAAQRAHLADLRRQRIQARRAGEKAAELRMRSKCIDGTLFAEVDGALTNVGTCSKRNY